MWGSNSRSILGEAAMGVANRLENDWALIESCEFESRLLR